MRHAQSLVGTLWIDSRRILWSILFLACLGTDVQAGTDEARWHAGRWDSTVYNLMDHPRAVGIRIEAADAETRVPVTGIIADNLR